MLELFGYTALVFIGIAFLGTIIDEFMSKIDKKYRKNF